MSFLEGAKEGALTGATLADVVAVPGASTRRLVRNVHFSNRDTVQHTVILYKDKAGTQYELAREVLDANGGYWTFDKLVVLDDTDEKLVAKTDATATTTEPSYDSAYADAA